MIAKVSCEKEVTGVVELELNQLRIDGGTEQRAAINEETVAEYNEALRNGAKFPEVVVFKDGATYWLTDGFHRYHAHRRAGRDKIAADVREGKLREAMLYSVGANADHGLRRTNADKRKAVTTMLTNELVSANDDGFPWSDRTIARMCGVSHEFVRKVRGECFATESEDSLSTVDSDGSSDCRSYTTKQGTKAVMNTSNIGRRSKKRRKRGATAPEALTPVHSQTKHLDVVTLQLPYVPEGIVRGLVSAFGDVMCRQVIQEMTSYLEERARTAGSDQPAPVSAGATG